MFIREARKAKGMTMKELGNRVGCSEAAISLYELGKREASYEMLLKIAEVLEVDVNYLLRGKHIAINSDDMPADNELDGIMEQARNDEQLRMLFKLSAGASADDVKKAIAIIKALRGIED